MHTRLFRPDHVAPEEVDAHLETGWYRVGQSWMTCRFVHMNGQLRTALWTRLPLDRFGFSKGQRKRLARARRRFRIEEGPPVVDDAHQEVYTRYRTVARGERPAELAHLLYGEGRVDRFATREIALWDGDRLAGFCWFDHGSRSVQSLAGLYDPDYARASIGFLTLLLEIEWALAHDLAFHYTGYVLPGDPCMDYKLQVGPVEFLHPERGSWRPWSEAAGVALPTERLWSALAAVRDALASRGITGSVIDYRMFELPAYQPRLRNCLAEPAFVLCEPRPTRPLVPVVAYDLDRERYSVLRCVRAVGQTAAAEPDGEPETVEVWVVADRLVRDPDPAVVAEAVARLL